MRVIGLIGVLVLALYSGLWLMARREVEAGLDGWRASEAAAGRQADLGAAAVGGFPGRVDLTLTDLDWADPASGTRWRAPVVQVTSMAWKPWHLIAALSPGQSFVVAGQTLTLEGEAMRGSVELTPGMDLALDQARVEGRALRLVSDAGWQATLDEAFAASATDPSRKNSHRIGLNAREGALGGLAADLAGQAGLPARIEGLRLDAVAEFAAPLDRHAGDRPPALLALDLSDLSLRWGGLTITARGRLAPDAAGLAAGRVDLQIRGWRHLLALARAAGALTPDQATVLGRGLATLAEEKGDPELLPLVLTAEDGQMSLGPLPLGPAPLLQP